MLAMTPRRFDLALTALVLGLALGSCTQVSGTFSDSWPHWAGGEPKDLPPRPGTPGYADFVAHKQAGADTTRAAAANAAQPGAANAPPPVAANVATGAQPVPAPAPANAVPEDSAVARGGLY